MPEPKPAHDQFWSFSISHPKFHPGQSHVLRPLGLQRLGPDIVNAKRKSGGVSKIPGPSAWSLWVSIFHWEGALSHQ